MATLERCEMHSHAGAWERYVQNLKILTKGDNAMTEHCAFCGNKHLSRTTPATFISKRMNC